MFLSLMLTLERLTTGSKNLDDLFGGGGIETGAVTQLYGAPGSGKTQLCYIVCALSTSERKAIYIDTEGTFCPERIESIARTRGLDPVKIFQNIQVVKPLDSHQQESYKESPALLSVNLIKNKIVNSRFNDCSL